MSGVMFNFVGACLATALVFGGGLFQSGEAGTGLTLIAIGGIGMGFLLALALTVSADEAEEGAYAAAPILTLNHLTDYYFDNVGVSLATSIYLLGDKGFEPAGCVFLARINGERAIVIERAEPVDDRTEVLRPVFSDKGGM